MKGMIDNQPHNSVASSLPSAQSASPSHTQSHGMHCSLAVVQLKVLTPQLLGTMGMKYNISLLYTLDYGSGG